MGRNQCSQVSGTRCQHHKSRSRVVDLRCSSMGNAHRLAVGPRFITYYFWLSYFAARQERLLQGLMREIIRMTAHKTPLEVGVPLYPFSHTTLFRKDGSAGASPDSVSSLAPLPVSLETRRCEPRGLSPSQQATPPMANIPPNLSRPASSTSSWGLAGSPGASQSSTLPGQPPLF